MSKDLEDIVTLFDGCQETGVLLSEGSAALQNFIAISIQAHLKAPEFVEAVEGCFRADPVSQERFRIVFNRMRSIEAARL